MHDAPGHARELNAILLASLKETLLALEEHIEIERRSGRINHARQVCPCTENECLRAHLAIERAEEDDESGGMQPSSPPGHEQAAHQ
jgi:hypothetical protein